MQILAALDLDWLPWALWMASIATLIWRWPMIRRTTLVAPAVWAVLALLLMAVLSDVATPGDSEGVESWQLPLRYFVGVTSLCPAMALFGAKRPQDRAWQFIVVTLWVVLSLPSVHWWLVGGGEPLSMHAAQSWFLLILWITTSVNYLPTRFAVSSLLVSVAQASLLFDFLPLASRVPGFTVNSLLVCTVALALTVSGWPKRRPAVFALDRVWIDFRDMFGAVWALRVQQRVNQSAMMYRWKLRLDWHGFTLLDATELPPHTEKALQDNLANLLRRFVSPAWIAERLKPGIH